MFIIQNNSYNCTWHNECIYVMDSDGRKKGTVPLWLTRNSCTTTCTFHDFCISWKKNCIKTTGRYTCRESITISFIQGEMHMPLIDNTKKATPLFFCNIKPLRKREHGANQMIINQVKNAFLCFNIWEVQVYYMYDNQYTTWVVH